MKRYAAHLSLITLMGVIALHTKAASSDPNSLLFSFIQSDEVTQGPIDGAALAQDNGSGSGPRLAAAEADQSLGGTGDVTADDPEVDFTPSADGSSVTAPLNPSNEAPSSPGSATPAEETTHRPFLYTVKTGDTLLGIADQFSITTQTISWANGLQDADKINPGDVLTILPTNGALYTVQDGDTISEIAKKFDVDPTRIIAYDGLPENGSITSGKRLIIPGASAPEHGPAESKRSTRQEEPPQPEQTNTPVPPPSAQTANRGGWVWPTKSCASGISQPFIPGRHTGIDIPGRPCGYLPPIYATRAGKVVFAGRVGGYGNFVIEELDNRAVARYGHLSAFAVHAGQEVGQGDVLGTMGSTGRSTGDHLHFEILNRQGQFTNPLGEFR